MYSNAVSLSEHQKADLLRRYGNSSQIRELSYGTVEDFCDSWDHLLCLTNLQGDLKDLQRPAALKLVLGCLSPGANLLEIGAGEPHVAYLLSELGYKVTIVDPYDGSGNGPTEFESYVRGYPDLRIIRNVFTEGLTEVRANELDCVYSISVLEHVPDAALTSVFQATKQFLKPGGYSIHLIDHVLSGESSEYHLHHLARVLTLQADLAGEPAGRAAYDLAVLLKNLEADNDTYFLSAEGHNRWRGSMPYKIFPFRKVVSVHTCKRYTRL